MVTTVDYYVDQEGKYYVNANGDNYIAGFSTEVITGVYRKHRVYFYHNGEFRSYTAFIRNADGSYSYFIPYIYTGGTSADTAVVGRAIAGIARAGNGI